MRRSEIKVTKEIISKAAQADSSHCMIADAIRAQNPAWTNVTVDLQTIRVTDKARRERFIYLTPLLAQQQLLRFDQGVEIEPWVFRLPNTVAQVVPIHKQVQKPTVEVKPKRHTIPTVRGGKQPPASVLSNSRGRRRVFGIRAAKGFDPSL